MTSLISKEQVENTEAILAVTTEEERKELLLLYTIMVDYAAGLGLEPIIRHLIQLSFDTVGEEFKSRVVSTCRKIQAERDRLCPTVNAEDSSSSGEAKSEGTEEVS